MRTFSQAELLAKVKAGEMTALEFVKLSKQAGEELLANVIPTLSETAAADWQAAIDRKREAGG